MIKYLQRFFSRRREPQRQWYLKRCYQCGTLFPQRSTEIICHMCDKEMQELRDAEAKKHEG